MLYILSQIAQINTADDHGPSIMTTASHQFWAFFSCISLFFVRGFYAARARVIRVQNRYFHTTVFKLKAQAAPVPRPVPLSRLSDNFLDGTSSVYLEDLQRTWEEDPNSVDESWDNFFRNFVGKDATLPGISGQTIQESMRLLLLVRAYQVNGHMKAKLDPLGWEQREIPDDLDPALYGFTEADIDQEFFIGVWRMSGILQNDRLPWSTQFENFLATKWTAAKRFGVEGGETLIPGMKEMFDRAADRGVESIIFSEFSSGTRPIDEVGLYTGTGDVKYHLGTSHDRPTRGGKRIHMSLVANPSHLEAVNLVAVGKTRAKQYYSHDADRTKNVGVLIHGDGSFAGQALNAPIFHVNGDDLEAVVHVCELAAEWRQTFHSDVVVDIVCYRRFGHNEMDEPSFTPPHMHKVIQNHPSALEIYEKKLLESGELTKEDIDKIHEKVNSILNEEFLASKDYVPKRRDWLSAYWLGFKSPEQISRVRNTGRVKPEILKNVGKAITALPDNFNPHRAVKKIISECAWMIETGEGIDWALAEALAFARLLGEGNHVRLSGQDVERGTFSHRHAVLHDQETGEKYCPLTMLS
ncbi:hypothetical protein TEA_023582 [Camellia sinensis var. sinensis]|uniref:2-oxoglutarate dehydrogenase, mitochondrial n=1 Tax=Camellia sinensis var. sinensis TaxID=542762 RepID=A0A4V3WL20_CAMSN|nr:hypothetical protein TEA_023582 [Camellia sinensis var. sinensis]